MPHPSGNLATENPRYEERLALTSEVLKKVQEVIGEGHASSDPEILSIYSRDFTITPKRRPNLVALPASTEEVQAIVRIANAYRVPVYVMTSGFNHAGSTIPRRGGIMVDLKRLNRILRIDEESMTATFQPYVPIAVFYEECSKRFAVRDITLRPANPITYGSACMMSNVLSGGIPFIALRSGSHAESIVSMTLVTPEGEILKTGSSAVPRVGDVPVLGPGPGVGGMFQSAEGNFGICTEMTLQLYTENPWPRDRTFYFQPVDPKEEGLEDVAEIFYRVTRDNYVQALYKSCNRHFAQAVAATREEVDAILENLPATILFYVLTGLDEEEIEIKKRHFDAQLEASGRFVEMPASEMEVFLQTMNMTEDQIERLLLKRCLTLPGRVSRWKGSFQWTTHMVKLEKMAEMEKKYRALMNRYWISPDYYGSSLATTTDTALQGPYPYGRVVMLEFDIYYDQGNPDEVKRAAVVYEKLQRMGLDSGTIGVKPGCRTLDLQMPRLGTYFEICKRLKKAMDPNGIMSPDTMPIMADYL
ncbi:MAG: FAD-binding oxidoreductase [bacterium]